jgi:hypothetical protein
MCNKSIGDFKKMRKTLFLGVAAAAMMLAQHSFASVASVEIGGRFNANPSDGYVYGAIDYGPHPDNTGVTFGTAVDFNRNPLAGPGQLSLSLDTPNFGEITADFTYLISFAATPAGLFYTLGGEIDGGSGFISINDVFPGHGIASFGLFGSFAYTAPPPVDPPPPPCLVCDPPPPPATATPEPSTWVMLSIGFGLLTLWRRHWLFPIRRRSSI